MKGAVFALLFVTVIATSLAQLSVTNTGCTCPNILTGAINFLNQIQTSLSPLLTQLGGLGAIINGFINFFKGLLTNLGNALSGGNILAGAQNFINCLFGIH
ncbi:unnamed protein product [Phyllotreta striolata]|uniref:Uncharacterized protein n=1 Tax=Phyllotreta striolata TaxID=444603 RepID=A0A9N9TKP6_PHYSR|nr:unnamed protein product [Phyllotreta striolata]